MWPLWRFVIRLSRLLGGWCRCGGVSEPKISFNAAASIMFATILPLSSLLDSAAAGGASAAAAADGLSARAPGYSATPRRARGMNPTMDLERAITPISLSQWAVFECDLRAWQRPRTRVGETAP